MMSNPGRTFVTWTLLGLMTSVTAQAQDTFATIDGEVITIAEFERFAYAEAKQEFYHGSPLDEEGVIAFRRAAADKLIDHKLKIREARQRGLEADEAVIDEQLEEYEARYGETERWQLESEAIKAGLSAWLEDQSLLAQIDGELRKVSNPDDVELRKFYDANLDKFTQPEQLRVSLILLQVSPSSGQGEWEESFFEAEAIVARVLSGSEFAEEARQFSDDHTASNGGDMGYVHAGTLGPDIQAALDELEPGQMMKAPVRVLEGVVLAKLEDRRPDAIIPLSDIRERALSLYRREASNVAYEDAVGRLRSDSEIWVDESVLTKVGR